MKTKGWLLTWPQPLRHYIVNGKPICGIKMEVFEGDASMLKPVPPSMKATCCQKCWKLKDKQEK